MYICPECKVENRPTAKFCRKCGFRRTGQHPVFEPESEEKPENSVKMETAAKKGMSASGTGPSGKSRQVADKKAKSEVPAELNEKAPVKKSKARKGKSDPGKKEAGKEEPAAEVKGEVAFRRPRSGRRSPRCKECGSTVRLQDKFCIWCGHKQPVRQLPKMKKCPECRTELPVAANFCYICGEGISAKLTRTVHVSNQLFDEDDPELFPSFDV